MYITDDEDTEDESGIPSGTKRARGKGNEKRRHKKKKSNKKPDNKGDGQKPNPEKSQEKDDAPVTDMLTVNSNLNPSHYNVTSFLRSLSFFL